MSFSTGTNPSQKEVLRNLTEKENDTEFRSDMEALFRTGVIYDFEEAMDWVKAELVSRI